MTVLSRRSPGRGRHSTRQRAAGIDHPGAVTAPVLACRFAVRCVEFIVGIADVQAGVAGWAGVVAAKMLAGQAVQTVVVQADALAAGVGLADQVAQGVIGVIPRPHIRVAHLQLAPAQVVAQAGRRPAALYLEELVFHIVGVSHCRTAGRDHLAHPAEQIAAGAGGRADRLGLVDLGVAIPVRSARPAGGVAPAGRRSVRGGRQERSTQDVVAGGERRLASLLAAPGRGRIGAQGVGHAALEDPAAGGVARIHQDVAQILAGVAIARTGVVRQHRPSALLVFLQTQKLLD